MPSSGWFNATGSVVISATPNIGYAFSRWSSSPSSITFANAGSASTTATIGSPGTIAAQFAISPSVKLSLSKTSSSVAPGHSITTTLTIAGSPSQSVKLAHSTLPKGITMTFGKNPITDSSSGVADLVTVKVSTSVKAGTYHITITATGANGQKASIVYTLTVT